MSHNKMLYTALLLLQGCCVHSETQATAPIFQAELKRVWMITEFPTLSREQLVQLQARLDLTQLPQAVLQLGCHDFAFQAQMAHGHIQVHQLNSTMPICNCDKQLAEQLNYFMLHAQLYRVQGHFLTLTTSNGETMRFVAQDWD